MHGSWSCLLFPKAKEYQWEATDNLFRKSIHHLSDVMKHYKTPLEAALETQRKAELVE